MISPGFPYEQPFFTRGLARQGATVIGLGDQPEHDLNPVAKAALKAYLHVRTFGDEGAIIHQVRQFAQQFGIHQVECTWEPYMTLAAKIRENLGIPGMTLEQTIPFRDKEVMKQKLDAAGIRTPRHRSTSTESGVREAVKQIGYPVCVKPIAGAGSADTYRVDDEAGLEAVLPAIRHVPEVSVEEFIDGEEFTYDTICANGEIKFFNLSLYRPRPLVQRQEQWISPQTIIYRDVDAPELREGRAMGEQVIKALGFLDGFTHMEWFRKPDGEVVFGEIAARPPGASLVDMMNYSNDADMYEGWAEAVLHHRWSQPINRKYNCGHIFKRAQGEGRIQGMTGLEGIMAQYGQHICVVDLLPIGAQRRNWKQTLRSDGMIIFRHPDFATCCEIGDQIGMRLQMYAG
jgi:biotin carboxylase